MERNYHKLQEAMRRFPVYGPGEQVWNTINEQLGEQSLRNALGELPGYEPDEQLWTFIDAKSTRQQRWKWGYVAAVVLIAAGFGRMMMPSGAQRVAYSQEIVDVRLQMDSEVKTDQQYKLLKAYCQRETLVCESREYRTLQQEYEMLGSASEQLSQAIGHYNTEPELVRQYNEIEKQKADILNALAKMI